jgi:hypothetical protein
MQSISRMQAVVYMLCAACSGAATTLGLVSLLCFPADSPTPTLLSTLALPLAGASLLALATVSLRRVRGARKLRR